MSSEASTRSGKRRAAARQGDPSQAGRTGPTGPSVVPPGEAPGAKPGGLQPWHVFVFGGLAAASAGALAARATTPANVVLVCLGILVASGAALALYQTLVPLVGRDTAEGFDVVGGRTRAALEREKLLVLRAIKDLEFDRAMRKISEADCQDMTARLRARAVRLIRQLDTGAAGYRELIDREIKARLESADARLPGGDQPAERTAAVEAAAPGPTGQPAAALLCPACRSLNDPDARFCKQCGTKLTVIA